MREEAVLPVLIIALMGLGALLVCLGASGGASGATVTVPDDYPTIQSAIENATDNDTLFIKDGLYNESVVVYRPMTIMGESQEGTVISNEDPFALLIVANEVSLSNVTVQATTTGAGFILQASYCVIENVTVRDSLWGLWVNRGHHNVVRNVKCLDNDWQGLLVEEADHSLIEGVTCSGNNEGINVRAAFGTTIRNCVSEYNRVHGLLVQSLDGFNETEEIWVLACVFSNNSGNGIEVSDTDNVTVESCTIEDSAWSAMRFDRCNNVTVRECTVRNFVRLGIAFQGPGSRGCLIEDNTVLDEGIAWTKIIVHNAEDCVIKDNYINALSSAISVLMANNTLVSDNVIVSTNDNESYETVGIIVGRHRAGVLLPPTNVTLLRNEVSRFTEGIRIRGGWDIDIIDCTVKEADVGIAFSVFTYGDDPIVDGTVVGCTLVGCGVVIEGMQDVTFEENTIDGAGVGMYFNATTHAVKGNLFTRNIIRNCSEYGLSFNSTNGTNVFNLNHFINNTEHASAPDTGDAFDDGVLGNYWDDYTAKYPAAIVVGRTWDTPYAVGGSLVTDDHPLAFMYDPVDPVADAGEDIRVLAGQQAALDGSGSSDDAGVVNWTWTFNDGTMAVTLHGEVVNHTFVRLGKFTVTLAVRDAWGNVATDALEVEVYDDEPPVAIAGDDVDAFVGEDVILNGSASSDNGVTSRYEWTFKDGDGDINLVGMVVTYIFNFPGTYTVRLTVSDEVGNEGTDTLRAVLQYFDGMYPETDAGENQTVDQGTTVTLDGTNSTDNVGVVGYLWTFEEGGVAVTLEGSVVQHRFDLPGSYIVTLNASDAVGNWAKDRVTINISALERDWVLGPFIDDEGLPLSDVDVAVVLNGTRHTGTADENGYFQASVKVDDLVSPAKITASKDGWNDLVFDMPLGINGDPSGDIPAMEREEEEDGSGLILWIGLVILLVLVAVVVLWYGKR